MHTNAPTENLSLSQLASLRFTSALPKLFRCWVFAPALRPATIYALVALLTLCPAFAKAQYLQNISGCDANLRVEGCFLHYFYGVKPGQTITLDLNYELCGKDQVTIKVLDLITLAELARFTVHRPVGNDYVMVPFNGCGLPYQPTDDLVEMPPLPNDPCGMPVWRVSEPYISLWLHDQPLGYQPSMGPRVTFDLSYKHRDYTAGVFTNLFGVGKKWNCSWLGCITWLLVNGGTQDSYTVHFPGGGQRTFIGHDAHDYLTNTRLTTAADGITVSFPDGSRDFYGL